MYKIKLLILLLISFIFISCTKNGIEKLDSKFSLGYISGEYYGLVLKNLLTDYLLSFDLYDKHSNYKIKTSINHSSNLYITNIDNTSDRKNLTSIINLEILNENENCQAYKYNGRVSQFYIFADSNKFISNNIAEKKIKFENTEDLVVKFINRLAHADLNCEKNNE